jgi:hypothetical protein
MATRATERDVRILAKCAVCRWLTTAQIQRAYFHGATLNAVQKRLRKLDDAGYLRSRREHPTAEAVHTVGPKGKPLVEERGIEVVLGDDVPGQLAHLLGVNEIRIAVETSSVPVAWFFSYWQLGNLGWRHPVIPDAMFAVKAPARRVFLCEYDRGTETLGKLMQKLQSYDQGVAGFPFQAVLIVTEVPRRLDLLAQEMRKKELTIEVLATAVGEIKESSSFFEATCTELPGGTRRTIFEPSRDRSET